jgi:hypothetical protein
MNDTVLFICIGFIVGVIASSAVWLVLFVVGKAQRQVAREKNLVMKAVAEESAEADKVLSSTVSKAMNPHALRSALSPRIDKMQKMLTENLHQLDTFFVKYMESRIAAYRAAFGNTPLVGYIVEEPPSGAQPLQAEGSAGILDEIKTRMESAGPADMPPAPRAPVPSRGRVLERPAMDPGTGVITVAGDVQRQQVEQRRPMAAPQKPARPDVRRPAPEPAFDLERAMGKTQQAAAPAADAGALHSDRIEKTVQWDRNQLMGAAAPSGEAIVVDGAEAPRKPEPPRPRPQPQASDKQNPIISGEDIENTMDSFFGLGQQ